MLDISNHRFTRLVAVWPVGKKGTNVVWMCYCDPEFGGCGKVCHVKSKNLRMQATRSCGCLRATKFAALGRKCRNPNGPEIVKFRKLGFTYKALGKMFKLSKNQCRIIVKQLAPELIKLPPLLTCYEGRKDDNETSRRSGNKSDAGEPEEGSPDPLG